MKMKSQITLHTRLDSGIYKSHGGGRDIIVNKWNCGPANLLKAIEALYAERESNVRSYGNIGCGNSWLEIDGKFFDETALSDEIEFEQYIRAPRRSYRAPISKIQIAKQYLNNSNW